jgi:hypothetical protein
MIVSLAISITGVTLPLYTTQVEEVTTILPELMSNHAGIVSVIVILSVVHSRTGTLTS